MLIRFPLDLPPPERKPEPWRKVIVGGLILVAVGLFLVYALMPALER
jgi:hypothetical protein